MIRSTVLLAGLAVAVAVAAPVAKADAVLIAIDGSDRSVKPAAFGYTVRTVRVASKVEIYIELTPDAAKALGHGELKLTKGGQTVVETTTTIVKDPRGKGTLKLTVDTHAIDGGELVIWSAPIKNQPGTHNFGGFRLSIKTLLEAANAKDAPPAASPAVEALIKAMDGFRKELPPAQGLGEMNGLGVADINGTVHPDSHLNGIAKRLEVRTKAECMALLTYLTDPDPKIRRIAAFALEAAVKAFPTGLSTEDIQKVDSDGHRKLVQAFIAGIEKLPK